MTREIGQHVLESGISEREAVDPDESLVLVAEHRRDEARAVEHPHLDVCLPWIEAACCEIEKRKVVLEREVLDLLDDRGEPTVDRMLGVRERLEEVGATRRGSVARPRGYRWLVTPARLGSSDGGSYHEYA